MNKLPLETVLSLTRRENLLGHGFDLEVEFSLAHHLAKSKHNDVVHRNEVLAKVTRFLNQNGWQLSEHHADYYNKYLPLFRYPLSPPSEGISFSIYLIGC